MRLLKSEYYELPAKYNQTLIRLLVQSPKRMFVYWEVSDDTASNFSKVYGDYSNCIPVLKISNTTRNYSYTIPVDPYANNYYLEVEDSGCNYKVELGRFVRNRFVNIYTSNEATVPLGSPLALNDFSNDGILFANYLCIADKKRIKVFGDKDRYKNFAKQNHTDFENLREFDGSSGNSLLLGSSDIHLGSSENYLGSSDNYLGSSNLMI